MQFNPISVKPHNNVQADQEVARQVPCGQVSEASARALLPVRQLQAQTAAYPNHQERRPPQLHLPRRGADARI